MQLIRSISLFAAFAIVMVHSMVPHQHRDELSFAEHEAQHEEASGLIDYLSLAFHLEHGEGQLEEFNSVQHVQLEELSILHAEFINSETTCFTEERSTERFTDHKEIIPISSYEERNCLRGPPSLS